MANGELTVEAALKFLADSGTKYVKESDLIAAKKGLESQVEGIRTELEASKGLADSKHQDLLKKTAELEEAGRNLSEAQKLGDQLKEAQDKLKEATTRGDQDANTLADVRRLAIHQKAGVSIEDLKKKTPAELTSLEEALKLIPADQLKGAGSKQSFDGGTGGEGGTGARKTGRQLIKDGLKASG